MPAGEHKSSVIVVSRHGCDEVLPLERIFGLWQLTLGPVQQADACKCVHNPSEGYR